MLELMIATTHPNRSSGRDALPSDLLRCLDYRGLVTIHSAAAAASVRLPQLGIDHVRLFDT